MIRPRVWQPDELRNYARDHKELVQVRPVLDEPELSIVKYKKKVFFKGCWTSELCEFRGTVVDRDFNVVMRPFTKIFNYGECGARIHRDEECTAVNKINGFMGQATVRNGKLLVATTGTMDSEFADLARKWIMPFENQLKSLEDVTYVFEICDPIDPHIITETAGLYLLGVRKNQWNTPQSYLTQENLDTFVKLVNLDKNPGEAVMLRPVWHMDTFQAIKDKAKYDQHEGYVVYGHVSGDCLKLKTPFYLTTKFIGRMQTTRLTEMLDNPDRFKQSIDEEFYDVIDYLNENRDLVLGMNNHERISFVRNFFENTL